MIRAATLMWLLLVVLSGMTAAVMLSGNYQLRALDEALGRALRSAIQQQSKNRLPIGWGNEAAGAAAGVEERAA